MRRGNQMETIELWMVGGGGGTIEVKSMLSRAHSSIVRERDIQLPPPLHCALSSSDGVFHTTSLCAVAEQLKPFSNRGSGLVDFAKVGEIQGNSNYSLIVVVDKG